ncbi:transposase [Rhodococcoides fascians]|uniref:transposase n=1 Tax=Rhodococcoides fascians TaxID=1828 RepID=UPI001D234E5A|nr:transposase [Rhodococcus fascians]CAH0245198.1 hypothetical protein SRABI91_02985 [Rhodococcus fascians]
MHPPAIRAAGTVEISTQLRALGVRRPTIPGLVAKALIAAEAQTVEVQAESTTEQLVTRLAEQLLELGHEINALDKQITERFRSHPQTHMIESVPNFGVRVGAEFLAIAAGGLAAFGTAAKLAASTGLAPVPTDSGTRTRILRRPKPNHRRLLHVFFMAAFSSAQREGPSREFYSVRPLDYGLAPSEGGVSARSKVRRSHRFAGKPIDGRSHSVASLASAQLKLIDTRGTGDNTTVESSTDVEA